MWFSRMPRRAPGFALSALLLWAAVANGDALLQDTAAGRAAAQPSRETSAPRPRGFRKLAPGVEVTIPPDRSERETFSSHDIVELVQGVADLKWTPKLSPTTETLYSMASQNMFRREVWALEFTFKPVRMIEVDLPQPTGKMQRKLIWYMVYHVKNTGAHLKPKLQEDGTYQTTPADHDLRFTPHFVLESPKYKKAYFDRIIPVAIDAIRRKEDPNRKLFDSAEIAKQTIPVTTGRVDKSVWGVATWEDVDPRVDDFSIYIQGLSNAYEWVDPPGAYKPGTSPGTGRVLTFKTLVLNFWRPGDVALERERTIYYGAPAKVDHEWIYR